MSPELPAIPALTKASVRIVEFHPAWFARKDKDFDTILHGMTSIR